MLTSRVKTVRMKPDGTNFIVAAGTTTPLTSDILDMQGFDGVRFLLGVGPLVTGAVTSVKVQQGQAANMSDGADLAGSNQAIADDQDNKIFISEIYRPQERYLRTIIARATQNATIDFLIAELYAKQGLLPVPQDATIGGTQEIVASPAEGTA